MHHINTVFRLVHVALIVLLFTRCNNDASRGNYKHPVDTLFYAGITTCSESTTKFDTMYADSLFVFYYPDSVLFAFRYINMGVGSGKGHLPKFLYPSIKFKQNKEGKYEYHFGPLDNQTKEDLVFKVLGNDSLEFQQVDIDPSEIKETTTFKGKVNRSVKYSDVVKPQ